MTYFQSIKCLCQLHEVLVYTFDMKVQTFLLFICYKKYLRLPVAKSIEETTVVKKIPDNFKVQYKDIIEHVKQLLEVQLNDINPPIYNYSSLKMFINYLHTYLDTAGNLRNYILLFL